jgi:hypothetical protein
MSRIHGTGTNPQVWTSFPWKKRVIIVKDGSKVIYPLFIPGIVPESPLDLLKL